MKNSTFAPAPTFTDVLAILKAYALAQAIKAASRTIKATNWLLGVCRTFANKHAETLGGLALILSLFCLLWMSMELQAAR